MARYSRKPVDVTALLQQSPLLKGQQQSDIVRQLNTELLQILQLENATFCKVNRIQAGRVQILCTYATWATRLKMQRDSILATFRQKVLPDCAGIDIEVNPNTHLQYQHNPTPQISNNASPQISEQAAAYLTAIAENSDPILAGKLRKLAELAIKKSTN